MVSTDFTVFVTSPQRQSLSLRRLLTLLAPLLLFLASFAQAISRYASKSSNNLLIPRSGKPLVFNDPRAELYKVGSDIPGIDLKVPPSYAGLMPVSNTYNLSEENIKRLRNGSERSLYFWLWLADEGATNPGDLVIWLSGGPGCSSVAYGMFEETSPIDLSNKTAGPRLRQLSSWTTRANMLYVEQPIPTGFSTGAAITADEYDASSEFYQFLFNWFEVFREAMIEPQQSLYLVGESYGGVYAPYRAQQLLQSSVDWHIAGILLINGLVGDFAATSSLVTLDFINQHNDQYLHLGKKELYSLKNISDTCGYTDYYANNVRFPQTKAMGPYIYGNGCHTLWNKYVDAAQAVNRYFNIYDVRWQDTKHPVYETSYFGDPNTANLHNPLNRSDVRDYIHAPLDKPFYPCVNVFPGGQALLSPANSALPFVVEKLKRTIVATAEFDGILMAEGTFMALHNMTWAGQRGFDDDGSQRVFLDAQGQVAGTYTERDKLAFVKVAHSGHMIPSDDPQSGLALLDALLGNRNLDGSAANSHA